MWFGRNFRGAFTLAEVLITLGIIGVVAALTMPSLIVKYEKQRTVTQLKKAYSEISQAIKLSELEYGSPEEWDYGTAFDGASAAKFMDTYLVPHLNVVKNCGSGTGCLKGVVYSLSGVRNSVYDDTRTNTAKIIVNSGYTIGLTSGGTYASIQVTLNNQKEKLVIGKDIFFFGLSSVKSKGKFSYSGNGFSREEMINGSEENAGLSGCSKDINSDRAGFDCTGLIVTDGWKISDDYPW